MDVRRIRILIQREFQDIIWNGQVMIVLFSALLMVGTVYILNQFGFNVDEYEIVFFNAIPSVLGFVSAFVVMYIQGNILVEEREHRTLKVLQLYKVSRAELFLAKSAITLFIAMGLLLVAMIVFRYEFLHVVGGLLFSLPMLFMFLFLGTLLAEYSKNTIEVSLYGWPIIIVYFMLEGIVNSNLNVNLIKVFPNFHVTQGFDYILRGEWATASLYIIIPILWAVLFYLLLKKKWNASDQQNM
ncbi:ABC transporter permease [Geomicrobium sp. JCM 19038]|uniref:ABC transporter permease n=1 Tax=Geomicrobium sp. JCM 19038 TaxID=1460635 RepID=UPI00045F34B4|nr:ABC transporter permease [Geomicrobium sp. JCM 19038]GAK09503.1 ABC transporter, permease protein [Geomicrobium sp. JCM 19038]